MLKLVRVLVPALLMTALAAPANASPAPLGDRPGDGLDPYNAGTGDIVYTRVNLTRALELTWRAAKDGSVANGTYWQLDLNPRDAGPEFRVGWTYDAGEFLSLTRTDDWAYGWYSNAGGEGVRCRGMKVTAAPGAGQGQVMRIPRSCLAVRGKLPTGVRAHLDTSDLGNDGPTDSAPDGETKLGPWTKL